MYGKKWVSYNVHGLVHMADVARHYGPLDEVSAFPFENFLGKIKRMVLSPVLPLQQVVKRLSESDSQVRANVDELEHDVFQKQHVDGPLPPGVQLCRQFKEYHSPGEGYVVTTRTGNNCILVNNSVAFARNFLLIEGSHKVVFQKFHSMEPFYVYPADSTLIGIYKVSRLSRVHSVASVADISKKYVLLSKEDKENNSEVFVAAPLLHSGTQ